MITPDSINESIKLVIRNASAEGISRLEKQNSAIGAAIVISTIVIAVGYVIIALYKISASEISGLYLIVIALVYWMKSNDEKISLMKIALNPKVISEIRDV